MQIIKTIQDVLKVSSPRPCSNESQVAKKNYAERFSRNMATCIANSLRRHFPGVTPEADGSSQEAPARTAKGFKKLDVGYSTPELGLALGVSVKSIHFPDPKAGRFTKNYSRNDNELRAEATDYHQRQPYAVLVGVLFLPIECCDDAGDSEGISSFGAAVRFFRPRAGREDHRDEPDKFERFFVAIYDANTGDTDFFDVMQSPPKRGRPSRNKCLSLSGFVEQVADSYNARNDPPFKWDE